MSPPATINPAFGCQMISTIKSEGYFASCIVHSPLYTVSIIIITNPRFSITTSLHLNTQDVCTSWSSAPAAPTTPSSFETGSERPETATVPAGYVLHLPPHDFPSHRNDPRTHRLTTAQVRSQRKRASSFAPRSTSTGPSGWPLAAVSTQAWWQSTSPCAT